MYLTVEDALNIYPLSEGKLTAGHRGLNRIVKSVNVMDAPDISDWVREGDMLFTTAYLIKDKPADGVQLLRKLADKGIAGIGIKLGRFWASVPENMLEEADRIGLPLIELPFPFTFSDQMKGLFNAELQKSTRFLQNVLDKQKELIRFALAADNPGDMFQRIQTILGCPLAVIGLRGQILFSSLHQADLRHFKSQSQKPVSQWIRAEHGRLLSIPLKSEKNDGEGIGRAVFKTPAGIPLKEEEGLFHQAAEIISYHLDSIERNQIEQSTQNEFAALLKSYLKQNVSSEALVECATRLGIPFGSRPYQCVITSVSLHDELKKERLLRGIRQELQFHPLIKDLSKLHFQLDGMILSIFPAEIMTSEGKLPALLTRVFKEISAESDSGLRITLSRSKHKAPHLLQAYRECLDAMETAERLRIDSFVVEFASVEMSYLFQSVSPEKMRSFMDMTLSPLIEKAPDSAQDLLHTLELYIQNNGQINEIAKQLYIHRNTAAYRLEKISELLQVDFKAFDHLLKLKLALLFRSMLQK